MLPKAVIYQHEDQMPVGQGGSGAACPSPCAVTDGCFCPPSIVTVAPHTLGHLSNILCSPQDQDPSTQAQVLENSPMPTVSSAWRLLTVCSCCVFSVVKLKIYNNKLD